jgi:signal transduction histidine kinase
MRSLFAKKGLETRVELPNDLPLVLADREQLRLILTQLLDNARRYTREGGVTVSASHRDGVVQVNVTDTGPGISQEELSKLFTRFYRVEGNNSPERGGGLGLAIARQLVERQGGQIWADSTVGQGSTFSFSLLVATEHADAVAARNNANTTA